jgi:hypothetical protein
MPIYQKPDTSNPAKGRKTYPYLQGGLRVEGVKLGSLLWEASNSGPAQAWAKMPIRLSSSRSTGLA